MKKPSRTSRPVLDTDHLVRLHHESSAVLSLLVSALTCAASADGEIRDTFDTIAQDHLTAYLDLLHTVSLHDPSLGVYFSSQPTDAPIPPINRDLRIRLAGSLQLRHSRLESLIRIGDSKRFYQEDTLAKEKQHLAEIVRLLIQ